MMRLMETPGVIMAEDLYQFHCEKCGARMANTFASIGKRTKCRQCKHVFQIPPEDDFVESLTEPSPGEKLAVGGTVRAIEFIGELAKKSIESDKQFDNFVFNCLLFLVGAGVIGTLAYYAFR